MLQKDIIITGLDRCGKSTLVANLWTHYNKMPYGCNIIRGDKMQKDIVPTDKHQHLYMNSINYAFNNMKLYRDTNTSGIRLYDRLHLDEVVYGTKYRGYDTSDVFKLEESYVNSFDKNSVFLIVLVDEPANLVTRDDGLGFTADIAEMAKEKQLFIDAYSDSNIEQKILINIKNFTIQQVFNKVLYFVEDTY
jgi:hypothetical protein